MRKVLLITTLTILFAISHLPLANADIPHLIGYQGRLTDANDIPINGSRSITFRIYDASAGGNLLWQETHPNVIFVNGIFDVLLGSITALDLPFDKQYYLAIQVGSDPEMTPRQQVASVGYAYRAKDTDTVDGINISTTPTANQLLPLDGNAKFPNSVLNDSASTQFGSWATRSDNTVYQAATDGFVVVTLATNGGDVGAYSWGYADSNSPPATIRGYCSISDCGEARFRSKYNSFTMPVKKNDYWKVVKTVDQGSATQAIYWIPLEFSR